MSYELSTLESEVPPREYPTLLASGDYREIAVLHNPASKRGGEIDQVVASFEAGQSQHGLRVEKLQTYADPAANAELLSEFPDSTIVVIWSGDGGTSRVLRGAHDIGLTNPILILPGGTKNDLAQQVARRKHFSNPTELLRHARLASLSPVELTVRPTHSPAQTALHKAFAYASQGVSAEVAHAVNTPEYRAKAAQRTRVGTYLAERRIAAQGFMHAQPFAISNPEATRRSIDILLSNGSQMAGGSMKFAADLFKPEAHLITVRNRLTGAGALAAMGAGAPFSRWMGEKLDAASPCTLQVTHEQPMYVQVDGDEFLLDGASSLHFQIAAHGLAIVTTRRK